jgi:hypothetical protein
MRVKPQHEHERALHGQVDRHRNERSADEAHRSSLAVLRHTGELPEHHHRRAYLNQTVKSETSQGD